MSNTGYLTWQRSVRASAAVLAILVMNLAAQAGTFTIVDLPATGTDAAIGIDSTKEYTHTFDFGSGTVATVNGVAFERGLSATISAAYTGTSQQGYGWTITDTRSSVAIAIHAGSDPSAQCDGDSVQLLYDMIYHSGSTTTLAGIVLTLSDLTPGVTYSTRYYYRSWGSGETARTITCQGDGGHNGDFSDTIDVEIDGGGAHYLEYVFTADDTDVTFKYLTNDYNNGIHMYGLSNEVASAAGSAAFPSPANGEADVLRDVVLSWTADEEADTHDVYFGTSREEVEAATTGSDLCVSEGQTETTFDAGRLEFGATYYWRVDEVGTSVVPGTVWSFTVESYSYALTAANITATASSVTSADSPASKTIDGSGLTDDQHSVANTDMWLSLSGDAEPWIQYEFDQVYRMDKMLVWNSNLAIESAIGAGAKAVTILTSLDGENWTTLGDFEFAQASGLATYTANTTVDFAGTAAKYVKLAINSNWSTIGYKQYSLSEVRFFEIPTYPSDPTPRNGATAQKPAVTLSWKSGREAGSHQVYLGTDASDMTLLDTVAESAYDVDLSLGQTYYWQVVEVNDAMTPSTWESPVWSFTTDDSILIEGFESYNDEEGSAIFQTWIDGYGVSENGSLVGYDVPPYAEETLFFAGAQSMPFRYNNSSATYSEAVLTFDETQDWTAYDVQTLSLYFLGDSTNTGTGQLYVKINGTKVLYDGAATDLLIGIWQPWTIDLASTGINLKKVTSLTIGVSGSGATGTLLIDEIRLYPKASETITPADPGTTGLVAYYPLDGDATDAAGNHDGTLTGSPGFATGYVGKALNMTSDSQYVAVPYSADFALSTFTVAAWINVADFDYYRGIVGTRIDGNYTFDMKAESTRIHGDIGNGSAWLNTSLDISTAQGGVIDLGEWHHVTYVIDNATQACYMYLDGALGATASFSGTPMFMISGETLGVGCDYPGENMHGQLDEVRIYNRALSSAEVAGLVGRTGTIYVAP